VSERIEMLVALAKEVLGPRDGMREKMAANPRSEYITGILAPLDLDISDIEPESEFIEIECSGEEDENDSNINITDAFIPPALQPKSLPRSMGISFMVRSTGRFPEIEMCATWGRYLSEEGAYVRRPCFFLTGKTDVAQDKEWVTEDKTRLVLKPRCIDHSLNIWRVSVFLVNDSVLHDKSEFPSYTKHFVFQPEIRIVCCEGSKVVPLSESFDGMNFIDGGDLLAFEDKTLDLLYRKRQAMARGHMVGATWKDIDPQRPHPFKPPVSEPPFAWIDAGVVPEKDREKFVLPDVRTDYLPMYPVEAPSLEWDENAYGRSPEISPQVLSELWDRNEIRMALEPIVTGYATWLDGQRQSLESEGFIAEKDNVALRLLEKVDVAIARIKEGIELVCENEEIRLAFCFANKAISLQYEWGKRRKFEWRLFQLAFILMNIPAMSHENHPDRDICDLLWFATGGGKTEAYLGLAAFTIALRRLRSDHDSENLPHGAGTCVISRYTLRLLTIQQFRRALKLITACEYLRVMKSSSVHGWRPAGCGVTNDFLWGTARFSAGLWVGRNVTPNSLRKFSFQREDGSFEIIPGAIQLLKGDGDASKGGEPAQVLSCPCCGSLLAVKNSGLQAGAHMLHLVFSCDSDPPRPDVNSLSYRGIIEVNRYMITSNRAGIYNLSIEFSIVNTDKVKPERIDRWWNELLCRSFGVSPNALQSARASRPGYFITKYSHGRRFVDNDFMIFCPNPECSLNTNVEWREKVPVSISCDQVLPSPGPRNDYDFQTVPKFARPRGRHDVSSMIPIPAFTVDEQIYRHCPTMLISTSDKFARLAFEPMAASIFGNVEYYHPRCGYYREFCVQTNGQERSIKPHPTRRCMHKRINPLPPPSLIIQDELHLIEGPLGSMVGIYETAIDELCSRQSMGIKKAKYIVSTATVRQASTQVQALYQREFNQFPAFGTDIDDNFFSKSRETHPFDDEKPGRLYVGICAPGKGAQTPLVRIYSSLLQTPWMRREKGVDDSEIDGYWTLVGYFNAVRELAGAVALLRQDIPQRLMTLFRTDARPLPVEPLELSSRKDSMELPGLLDTLEKKLDTTNSAADIVLSTSMFGTGVDVDRLKLMVVNGQPKSTASYIQATGRVGRSGGGLVVTFFRASRPRDLAHYEFFTGYHRSIYKHVEPVTVAPFSPRCRERSIGPLAVILLRIAPEINGMPVHVEWRYQQRLSGRQYECDAARMSTARLDPEIREICQILERRALGQPEGRRPDADLIKREIDSELDKWQMMARKHGRRLIYHESSMSRLPENHVVLGDSQHYFQNLEQVYRNAPQSLRDVEATLRFET
jgi:hypothetical protein